MTDATRIDAALRAAIAANPVPGVVAMATTEAGTIYQGVFGRRDVSQDAAMLPDTIFAIASMTKAITSVAAMQLVEQGRLSLDAPIGAVLPALASPLVLDGFDADGAPRLRPANGPITLRHLLTHTSGYGYDTWNPEIGRAVQHLGLPRLPTSWPEAAGMPLLFDPGTRWNYGIGTDIVGKAVEAASGQPLDAYLRQHVLGPLGMHDTGFLLTPARQARRARMHQRQDDGSLLPSDRPLMTELAFCTGGGALSSTVPDYTAFLRMLLAGGGGLLRPQTVAEMGRNQIGDIEVTTLRSAMADRSNDANLFPGMVQKWGLGFLINTAPGPAGRSAGSLAWAGLTNCYYWLDPTRRVAGVIMMQILPFADARALRVFAAFERAVYDSL